MSGIKKITDEVKSAVAKSVEPMKEMTNQAKNMASQSASSVSKMKSQIKSYSGSINETAKQQEYLKSKISDLKDMLAKADMGFEVGDTMKIEAQLEQLENRLRKLEGQGSETGEKTSGVFGLLKDKVKSASSHISNYSKKLKEVLSNSKNLGKSFSSTFNNGVNSIKKFALGLLSIRTAVSMVSKAMQSYLSYDTQLSNSIQNCWNVLGSLLAPILEYVVSLFSKAVSYVNAFVQALTGINLVARANSKAINNQSKATKGLQEAQSSLDEFHTVNKDSGTGGGGSNSNPITVDNVSIDGLWDKIFNYDWYKVGVEIGHKINEALAKIPWDFIQKLAVALAFDLASLLNGLVDGIDWNLLGTTIGNGIQTALLFAYTFMTTFNWQNFGTAIATGLNGIMDTVDFTLLGQVLASKLVALIDWLYGFVTTFDWSKFGTSIAETIMGWWNSIDWGKAGETLSTGIRGLFTSIKNLIAGIDWQQLGKDIWTFIASIDWSGMVFDLAFILGQAIAGIGQFIWGFIEDAVNGIKDYFAEKFKENGGNIIAGLLDGIIEAIANIGQWLWDNVCAPFIDGFKSMFGIHSPSTVMAELGIYIIEGLKNGLLGLWEKCKEIFENLKSNIGEKFTEILNNIKEIFSIENIKSYFSQVLLGIQNVFSSIPNWFKDKFSQAWTNVKNVFSSGGKVFDGIKDGILSSLKSVINSLILGINKVIKIPFDGINAALKKVKSISILGAKPFDFIGTISVPKIPSLASGGVLDQETLVRVAEYSNAKSNPEIVSPKDMMKETVKEAIEESGMTNQSQKVDVNITGELTAKGDDLVYVYDKTKNDRGYDGGKNPSFAY